MFFQNDLLKWFDQNKRPLPWRKHYRPYEVWVSEIMLQQTQVDTALPYFKRWMKTFPTIESLAEATEEKVLKLWQGLGYYSRARNLHASAKLIQKDHKGHFPTNYEEILKLKGIGRYTAGAIASIAFNQEKPIVDGNVFRVLSRLYAIQDNIDIPKNREKFWQLAEELIPKGEARYFNQAMMELGALICTTRNPKCSLCPIQKFCKAFQNQNQEGFPVRSERRKTVKVQAGAVLIVRDEKYYVHRRPVGEIMGGLWEFPEWKLSKGKALPEKALKAKLESFLEKDLGLNNLNLEPHGKIKRSYTHHQENLHLHKVDLNNQKIRPSLKWPAKWVTKKEFKSLPFSSAHAKIVELIQNQEQELQNPKSFRL